MLPRDLETPTVEAAAGFERYHALPPEPPERPTAEELHQDQLEREAWNRRQRRIASAE